MIPLTAYFPYALLGGAIAAVPICQRPLIPLVLYAIAVVSGLATGALSAPALLTLGALALGSLVLYSDGRSAPIRIAAIVLLLLAGHLVLKHLAPGFNNLLVLDRVQTSPDAVPYSQYLNFNKASLGFFLFLFAVPHVRSFAHWAETLRASVLFFIPAAIVLIGTTYLAGAIRFDPKLVPFLPLWIFVNLLFTCVPEELFFRRLVMGQLENWLGRSWLAAAGIMIVSSIFFGYYHLGGGLLFAAFSVVAGLFYGLAYWMTNRVEVAIGCHFLVNLTHILFFTYPLLQHG